MAVLKLGSRSEAVRALQVGLCRLGYHLFEQNGVFGPRTTCAVLSFQADNGLRADGAVGPETSGRLEAQLTRLEAQLAPLAEANAPVAGVLHYPSPNYGSRGGAAVEWVVVHYTEAALNLSLDLLTSPAHEASTHFLVDRGGRLFQLVHPDYRAWHAGTSEWQGRPDVNSRSVGIDAVFHPREHTSYTDVQYAVMGRVIRELALRYPLAQSCLVGHEHVAVPRGRKKDPGPHFDWDRLRRLSGFGGPLA